MQDQAAEPLWVSEYDYARRVVTLTLCGGGDGDSWSGISRDKRLSDPEDRFVVFTANRYAGNVVVKVVARLDGDGALLAPHPDFNEGLIGSLTLWPYRHAGSPPDLEHWMWWSRGLPFSDEPRGWADATSDRKT